MSFGESNSGIRYSVQSCYSLIGHFSNALCCESTPEERRAGNPHAAFRGNRRRVTAFGNPVWRWATASSDPVWWLNTPVTRLACASTYEYPEIPAVHAMAGAGVGVLRCP